MNDMIPTKIIAVAVMTFFDNEILQQVVEVPENATWKESYLAAVEQGLYDETPDANFLAWVISMSDDLDEARAELVNGEIDICVTEFTNKRS